MTDAALLTPEAIAAIRDEVNALLQPHGLRADDGWRQSLHVYSSGESFVCLKLNVPRSGNTMEGVEVVVDAQIAVNDRHPEVLIELTCGLTYDDE